MDSRGAAYLSLSALTIGGFGVVAGLLSAGGVSAFTQTFWRFLITAAVFITVSIALFGRETIPGKRELVVVVVAGGLMMAASVTYIGAIAVGLPVPIVSFLSQLSTVITVLFAAPLLHEALTRAKVLVISLGTAGVFLISHPWSAVGGNLPGELLVLLNAVVFAFITIFSSEYIRHRGYKPQLYSTWMFTGAALWSLPFLAFNAVQPFTAPTVDMPALIGTMVLMTFVPYSLMNLGLKTVGAGPASVLFLISPIASLVLSYLVLGEEIGVLSGIGSGLIVLSVIVLAISEDQATGGRLRAWAARGNAQTNTKGS